MNIHAKKSQRQKAFEASREDYSDREIQMEQLYYLRLIQDGMERNRNNTANMVWFLIVIPIAFAVLIFFVLPFAL